MPRRKAAATRTAAPPTTEQFVITGIPAGRGSTATLSRGQYGIVGYSSQHAMQRAIADGDWLTVLRTQRKAA